MRTFLLILAFVLPLASLKAQSTGLFPGIVKYSESKSNNLFLSNKTSEEVKLFYLKLDYTSHPVSETYSDGYHLTKGDEVICVMTVSTSKCIEYFEKNHPDMLSRPFKGFRSQVGSSGHSMEEYKNILNQYNYLACRLYRSKTDETGNSIDELNFLLAQYEEESLVDIAIVSTSNSIYQYLSNPETKEDGWNHWMRFLKDLESKSYITLIEYN